MQQSTHRWARSAWVFGSSALCIVGISLTLSAQDVSLSANVRAGGIDSLQRDEPGSRIRRSRAIALMPASMEQVTAVVSDYANYRQFMPHFVASRVLSQRGQQALMYAEVSALEGMATLWVQMQLHISEAAASTRVIRAKMLKGNLKGFKAEWQVTPFDATHTLVAFELCAEPDFHLPLADGLISDYNEKEARSTIMGLRRQLSGRPPYGTP
jgi:ribosome-associated toxin RatA of RatAB toxin-antitoxin module